MLKDDSEAFIFTLKNAHGVEPTRFMKRKESKYAIECNPYDGPTFGESDIYIDCSCNRGKKCYIHNEDLY